MANTIIRVEQLRKYYAVGARLLPMGPKKWLKAVDGIDFSLVEGEGLSLVGESGCGKTTTARLVLMLEEVTGGSIQFTGTDILRLSRSDLKVYRRSVQAVFQDPYDSLDPRQRVEDIVGEPIKASYSLPRGEVKERVYEALGRVGLSSDAGKLYPHEFSGGQRQRIAIARAIAVRPKVITLDEPVSALDVSIQAQIMNLLKDIQEQFGLSYLVISHDLAVAEYMSAKIAIMYLGKIVEVINSHSLSREALHPYTEALLAAALPSHPDQASQRLLLPGELPSPVDPPTGCRFHTRCLYVRPICRETEPSLSEVDFGHSVACHIANSGAPREAPSSSQ